jgi:hypothetical protein
MPEKNKLPGGESNPALARSARVTGACTNPIYYQGLEHVALHGLKDRRSSLVIFSTDVPFSLSTVAFRTFRDTLNVTYSRRKYTSE